MSGLASRGVAFGGSTVRIEYSGRLAEEVVSFLFRSAEPTYAEPAQGTFRIEQGAGDQVLTVSSPGGIAYTGDDAGAAAHALQDVASYALSAGSTGGLLLHAAAVALNGRGVVLPGKTGSGKTTLTAHLVRRGYQYLTDELVFLREGGLAMRGCPRPLNVKPSGRAAVDAEGWERLDSPSATLVLPPAAQLSAGVEPSLAAVVFPRFREGAESRLTPLKAGERGLRLMAVLLNARNLDEHGFPAVAELARITPGYELIYGDVREAGELVTALLAGEPPAPTA